MKTNEIKEKINELAKKGKELANSTSFELPSFNDLVEKTGAKKAIRAIAITTGLVGTLGLGFALGTNAKAAEIPQETIVSEQMVLQEGVEPTEAIEQPTPTKNAQIVYRKFEDYDFDEERSTIEENIIEIDGEIYTKTGKLTTIEYIYDEVEDVVDRTITTTITENGTPITTYTGPEGYTLSGTKAIKYKTIKSINVSDEKDVNIEKVKEYLDSLNLDIKVTKIVSEPVKQYKNLGTGVIEIDGQKYSETGIVTAIKYATQKESSSIKATEVTRYNEDGTKTTTYVAPEGYTLSGTTAYKIIEVPLYKYTSEEFNSLEEIAKTYNISIDNLQESDIIVEAVESYTVLKNQQTAQEKSLMLQK